MSKKPKRRQHNMPPKTWNLTELLYAFVGVLTQRKNPLIFSATHNCAPIAELVAAFIEQNGLPNCRPDYPKVQWPKGTDQLTNVPSVTNAVTFSPLTAMEALSQLKSTLNRVVDIDQRDAVIAKFLSHQKNMRQIKVMDAEATRNQSQANLITAMKDEENLESIMRGSFTIIEIEKPV